MTMVENGTKRQLAVQTPIGEIRQKLSDMGGQFRAALPTHIPVERFSRVVMTAVQNNPELLECDQRSLWNAAMKAAQDGLLPDGREGAITVRKDWKNQKKNALWQPMIAGIRKKARNSGEIATWDAHVVYENDDFDFEYGDNPYLRHKPALKNRGKIVAAYSVCTLKSGEKTREVMSIEEIYEVRDRYSDGWRAFKAGHIKSTPWSTSEEEMCRKTVARRHSKVIPMSSDLDDLIRRDDNDRVDVGSVNHLAARAIAETPADRLTADLDAIAAGGNGGVYDPETGEVIDQTAAAGADASSQGHTGIKENGPAPSDPTGEEAARQLAAKLEERAAAWENANAASPNVDPARQLAAKIEERAVNNGVYDAEKLAALLDRARAMATNGLRKFNQWEGKLGAPDATRLGPFLEGLRKAAAAADGGGA